jgi:hypothetical protein
MRSGIRQAALARLRGRLSPVQLAWRDRPRLRYGSAKRLRFLGESVCVAEAVAVPLKMLLGDPRRTVRKQPTHRLDASGSRHCDCNYYH